MADKKQFLCYYITAFALIAFFNLPTSAQTIWYVDADATGTNNGSSWANAYRELQSALTVATIGDYIWVAAGMYKPDYDVGGGTHTGDREATFQLKNGVGLYGGFAGGETQREQRDWLTNIAILSGDLAGDDGPHFANNDENSYHVTTGSGTDATAILDGFKITAGNANGALLDEIGAGICNYQGSPTIANNTITANSAGYGGGICCESSSPMIANNTITANSAGCGGGICCEDDSSPTIANNTITNNSAYDGNGGGIYCYYSSPTITNNTIAGNSTTGVSFSGGGGIYCRDSSSPTIANNTITGNSASDGGGICCYSFCSPTITNNTITSNGSYGIYCYYNSPPTIANTIVAFNSSGIYISSDGSPVLRHNCVYGNLQGDYCGITDPTGTDGNISVNPQLASMEYGNVHIQPDSPCKDTGDNNYAYGEFDMDGESRIQPEEGMVDIGADESDETVWPPGPYVIVRVSPTGNDANDGSSWPLAKRTIQAGIDTASAQGGEVWVQAGTYYEWINLHSYAHVYGGFAGTEIDKDDRDWAANVTTLDGQYSDSVVAARAGHAVNTIDGFKITNGGADYGGGIRCSGASPTIANNMITANNAGYGGGVYCEWNSSPTITNNTITANGAFYGGGIYCKDSFFPTIANNTITGNNAVSGGGIYANNSSLEIANTIVAFNSSGIYIDYDSSFVLSHNCVYGNKAYDYDGIDDPTGTDGNISVNPKLASWEYGNVHIQPDSPCKDTGDNAYAYGNFDMDHESRIQPGGGTVDIGADESDGTVWPAGPYVIVRVRHFGNDANDGSSWPLAKRTVQAAIDAASTQGGEVWVQAGTYYVHITLHPYVYLYGGFAGTESNKDQRDWTINVTRLDGQQLGSVLYAWAGFSVSTIDGFVIRNGNASEGGGIYCSGASPTITNNTITGNSASYSGGGIYCAGGFPTIANNTITANNATGTDGHSGRGGGIYCEGGSPTMVNNTITANNAPGAYGHGGGIFCLQSYPTIANNMITGNSANNSGGGIYCDWSAPTITNNMITANSASGGGGIYCDCYSTPTIANNTITGNSATANGGGIYSSSSFPKITNTILVFNSSGICVSSGGPVFKFNDVYGNTAYNYSGITDPTGTDGNISQNPRFVDKDGGNFRLAFGSPCIDAGDNAAVPADVADLDGDGNTSEPLPIDLAGDSRFIDDPCTGDTGNGTPPIVDMGAYEYEFVPAIIPCDFNLDYDVDGDDLLVFESCASGPSIPHSGSETCQQADFDEDNDVDQDDFAVFQRCFSGENRCADPNCAG